MTKEVTQARIANEIAMYGERPEVFWARHKAFVQMTSVDMFVSGLMSDAQECIAHGLNEEARQILNKAKWILFNRLEGAL